jgi:sigma-B regulation protein RsbU (phosphoserine phosphatase)
MFKMEEHGSMFFTLWYGVYRPSTRTLRYGTAGHHPAYLVPPERRDAKPLRTPGLAIGVVDEFAFNEATTTIPPGSRLYIFSDGVFEIVTATGKRWELDDFLPLLLESLVPGQAEPQRLLHRVHGAARRGPLEDDFSLLVAEFP